MVVFVFPYLVSCGFVCACANLLNDGCWFLVFARFHPGVMRTGPCRANLRSARVVCNLLAFEDIREGDRVLVHGRQAMFTTLNSDVQPLYVAKHIFYANYI
jgi:hypothetical protein